MNGGGYCGRSIVDEFVPHGSLDMPHIDHADWQVHSRCCRRHRCRRCRRRRHDGDVRALAFTDETTNRKRRDRISFRVYGNVLFVDAYNPCRTRNLIYVKKKALFLIKCLISKRRAKDRTIVTTL